MIKKIATLTLGLVASLVISAAAHAAPIRTLFLGADYNLNNVLTDIIGSDARFDVANSATFEAQSSTPTLAYLRQFDSILYWSNSYPADANTLGNLLADYVDVGGLVVRATFVGQEIANAGRIGSTGYAPFTSGRGDAYSSACLGSFDSSSSIMAGVNSICASTYRGDWNATLDTGASLIASWSDGKPFVGINSAHSVIDISLFPNVAEFGHASGDYGLLFANALAFNGQNTDNPTDVPEPSILALLGLGFAGLAAVRRRRNA